MAWISRTVPTLALGVLLSLMNASEGVTQSCNSDSDCAINQICEPGLFGGSCFIFACSSNAQCFARAPRCIAGACTRVVRGGPTSGGGTSLSGEGEACGPRRLGGGVVKSIPCQPGLRCIHAHCQRPLR
jgi:hypothetical protein